MPTANNNQAARSYQPQFKQLLQAVFGHQAYFRDFFGGNIEVLDGVQHNETAFYVKTSDIPVVIGNEYNKDPNVAFGSGTSNSTRFGERTEIIYADTPVQYRWEWVFHEGIDKHTVNNDLNAAVADRLDLQAKAKVERFNDEHSWFISESAGNIVTLDSFEPDQVLALFNELSRYYRNNRVIGNRVANVNTQLYNALVDHPLTTNAKNSSANIDTNGILNFKGFSIRETPDDLFQEGEIAYTYVPNVGKAFTGINTTRTIPSEDFDGQALQGAGKAGEFILEDNKKAVSKIVLGGGTAPNPEA
jgi:hypothetical protein